jgi:hypothetical protein
MQRRFMKISGAALLVTAALSLPAQAQRYQRHSWDGWDRGRGNGAFELDGTYVGMQQGCALIRDRQGNVVPLLGNPGDLQNGDHLLLRGQVQSNSVCGPAFRVAQVEKLWADSGYSHLIYDRRRDGDYVARNGWWDRYNRDHYGNNRGQDRQGQYGRDRNDNRDNGSYRSNRRAISVSGRLDSDRCPVLRTNRGEIYGLFGDLAGHGRGDWVRVSGFEDGGTRCGHPAIRVEDIRGR